MKKQLAKKLLAGTALSCLFFGSADDPSFISAADHSRGVKNIIFMIGDGMGPEYTTGYRYYKDDPETKDMEPTAFDPYLAGMQSVYSYDPYHESGEEGEKENITDSAAAGTALSSGIKTYNGAIAKDLDKEDTKTVLEAAKEKGMSTGLVVTAQVNHATPAAYGAHNESRQNYDAIADDYFDDQIDGEHKVDVLLGGGTDYFIRDDRDLTKEFQQDGYDYVTTTEEMADSDGGQILGLFGARRVG